MEKKFSLIRVIKKDHTNLKKNDIIVLFSGKDENTMKTLSKKVTSYPWAFNTIVTETNNSLNLSCFNEKCDRSSVMKISHSENVYECRHCGTLYRVNDSHSVELK